MRVCRPIIMLPHHPNKSVIMKRHNKCKHRHTKQESRAVARKPRDAAAVLFGSKFADTIRYKFKSSQASKAGLQSSKHASAKTEFNAKWSFKVIQCHVLWSQWKGDQELSNTYLLRFRRCSVYEMSAVLTRIPIFCGSRSAFAHLRWSRDVNKLNCKYVKKLLKGLFVIVKM